MASHIRSFCFRLSSIRDVCEVWFHMLPLFHFLEGNLEPNLGFQKNPTIIPWEGDCGAGINNIKAKMSLKDRLVNFSH